MQLSYQPVQDRLVLVLNNNEQADYIWLTRRFTKILLKELDKFVDSDPLVSEQSSEQTKQKVKSFQQETANQTSNFTRSKVDKQAIKDKEQILATAIGVDDKRVIRIRCSNDKVLSLNINTQMAYMFRSLVVTALSQSDWQLGKPDNVKSNKPVSVHYKASMTVN